MPLGPFAHFRQAGSERSRHDVRGIAYEDRPVAHAREALDVLDHLGVVVGRQVFLAIAAFGHRHIADEIREPRERAALQLGILVPEMVDVPCLVGDDQVVAAILDHVLEDHEIGDQDLVHGAQCLEGVEVVLAGLALDVPRFVDEQPARRMNRLARAVSSLVTGCWASQSTCNPGCSPRSWRAIARSRRPWPRPMGDDR